MKLLKSAFLCFFSLTFCVNVVWSQCPPDDVVLLTQAEIDNFFIQYPNCNDIPGNLLIGSYDYSFNGPVSTIIPVYTDIVDVSSLGQITSVGGYMIIASNDGLMNLDGLANLTSIAGDLDIYFNNSLIDLSGLGDLTAIGGDLDVYSNHNLINLDGLDNLTSVEGNIEISGESLVNLIGLENINPIVGDIRIYSDVLADLSGLENVTSVGGGLWITGGNLVNLSQLQNLTSVGVSLNISFSPDLTDLTGLENLTSVGASLQITGNDNLMSLNGLQNLHSVGYILRISYNGGLTNLSGLGSLNSVGNGFSIQYNDNLVSLSGMDNLASIGHNLTIINNDNLTDLSGLESVTSMGGLIVGNNDGLTGLNGIENVTSLEGNLQIGDNPNLVDLSGLENITSVGVLSIARNSSLASLSGVENIVSIESATSFNDLLIFENPMLSTCHVASICNYLDSGGASYIQDNAPNCNTSTEILELCGGLPIELDKLEVHLENETALLIWRTATETNNAGFEIQRSKYGTTWEKIAWQAGQGNTLAPHTYAYRDENPLFGISYYRLKQVDFNGDFQYSDVVSLQYIRSGISVFPNPNIGIFEVQSIVEGTYQIHNTSGQTIQEGDMQNNLLIDISREAQGVYFISVTIDNETFVRRIIKM